ncbi:MAG: Sensor protein FixL [Pseudomonadota bacterium]
MSSTPPSSVAARSAWWQQRGVLWALLVVLLLALLGTAIILAQRFQEAQAQAALELEAHNMVSDIRTGLNRNVQTLQNLQNLTDNEESWEAGALEILFQHREMTRLQWRDARLRLLSERHSPYYDDVLQQGMVYEGSQDLSASCAVAKRSSAPAFSSSQFWPGVPGRGLELIEMCLAVSFPNAGSGFFVMSYSLQGLLQEMIAREAQRGRVISFTEVDGTRLAILGTSRYERMLMAQVVLELPGQVMMLRIESPRELLTTPTWGITSLVIVLSALLLMLLGLLGYDMRLRLQAQRNLAEALAFRKAMEDSLVTGLRARDLQGRITYVNPAFCQMVGLSPAVLLGTGIPAPYWPPELIDEYQRRQAVRLAGQTLPREGFESVFMRHDGTRFPVLIIEAPLINAHGQQTGWMSAILDLTEQHRIEALQRASQERLHATARLATAGEMASLLSHELNQPLAAIASYAHGALNLLEFSTLHTPMSSPDVEDVRLAVRRIAEQAERAGKVIRSVADFVRRREQDGVLARERVPVDGLMEAIMPLLGLQARKHDIQLHIHTPPKCPPALCDRTMIEQVLLNLARNGIQAMPDNTPANASGLRRLDISVAVHTTTEHKEELVFAVRDHGLGLTPEVATHLFTPFFTTKAEGMGLGLSLCRTVIEQHGGALTYEAAQPSGTIFRFTLPVADDAAA